MISDKADVALITQMLNSLVNDPEVGMSSCSSASVIHHGPNLFASTFRSKETCFFVPLDGASKLDAECYNKIFSTEFPRAVFVGAGNSDDVENDPRRVGRLIAALSEATEVIRLVDLDDRSPQEAEDLQRRGIRVLTRRTIESYLLDDEILRAVCARLGNPNASVELIAAKQEALVRSIANGGPPDDFKRVAGDVYNCAKRLFLNHKLGNKARSFMYEVCAPEIVPGTDVYDDLKEAVFGMWLS